MKKLLTLFVILSFCTANCSQKDLDVITLTEALKILATEPTAPATNPVLPIPTPTHPFATHYLLILADTSEQLQSVGAISTQLNQAFGSQLPILATEELLISFAKTHNGLPMTYNYFHIPSNNGFLRYTLCIPSFIRSTRPSQNMTATISVAEKKLGLLLEHLPLIPSNYGAYRPIGTPELLGTELKEALEKIFVPNSAYNDPAARPRWILVFSGHGGQYQPYTDAEIATLPSHQLIKNYGVISGIDSVNFAKTIRDLNEKITLALIHISACFGGGINLGNLLYDIKTGVIPPYPFIVTTQTLTGDSCIYNAATTRFDMFFHLLKDIPVIDTEKFLQSPEFWQTEKPSQIYETAFKELYAKIPQALSYIIMGEITDVLPKYYVTGIPAIKPAAANYFIEVQLPRSAELYRIDKNTIKQYAAQILNVPYSYVLLYANNIPLTIRVTDLRLLPYLVSAIPGSTFHIIDKIEAPGSYLPTRAAIETLFPQLDPTIVTQNVTKLFHIKKLSTANAILEVRVIKAPDSYTALATSLTGPKTYTLLTVNNELLITDNTAADWIKNFNDKILFLKKLATSQAPYRFLKNADIETIPW